MGDALLFCVSWLSCCSCRSAGMHHESAGGEVQTAGSAGGSHAEGPEVSPTTEGRRTPPTAWTISHAKPHWASIFEHPTALWFPAADLF